MFLSYSYFRAAAWACLVIALLAGISPKVGAADLWEIYQLALANDPTYQAALINHGANELDLPLAKTAFKPSIGASAQMGRARSDNTGNSETNDDHNANLNFNWPLFDKSKRIEIAQSGYQIEISSLQVLNAKYNLILRVADRYFNLLAGQDAREVARLEKIAIKRQMDLANERLEVGLGTRTDLFDAKARFKQAEANEIQAQNKINNDIALLKQIIGTTPEALSPLRESAPLEFPQPNDLEAWIALSLENNIPLNIQKRNLEIAAQEIDKQKSARSPLLSLDANHRWSESGSNFGTSSSNDRTTTNIGLRVAVPLYLAGAINLRTEQAGLRYNHIERLLEQTRRSASTEVTSAFLDVTSGVSQVEALFDAITAGESALEAKEEGFNAGLTTNLDVLDAQRDLSRSRTDYLRARYNYILSVLKLEGAAGNLDEQDIKKVNDWLEDASL